MGIIQAVPKAGAHCHVMIAETAKSIAAEVYETWATNSDEFYKEQRSQEDYIAASWPMFIEQARTTLAGLLTTNIAEELKEQISDALIKDASLMRGRSQRVSLHYQGA